MSCEHPMDSPDRGETQCDSIVLSLLLGETPVICGALTSWSRWLAGAASACSTP
jgi:hypothetical protein